MVSTSGRKVLAVPDLIPGSNLSRFTEGRGGGEGGGEEKTLSAQPRVIYGRWKRRISCSITEVAHEPLSVGDKYNLTSNTRFLPPYTRRGERGGRRHSGTPSTISTDPSSYPRFATASFLNRSIERKRRGREGKLELANYELTTSWPRRGVRLA